MKKGFTLAEVLITMTIIGVIASLTIPSVISNTQQAEFKTGLRKAVASLNSAISLNISENNESPAKNANLYEYLQRHMSVIKATTNISKYFMVESANKTILTNSAFYTTDGMRYEFRNYAGEHTHATKGNTFIMYETGKQICLAGTSYETERGRCPGCGSWGLNKEKFDAGIKRRGDYEPCLITVDVNGDRKPNPANINCRSTDCLQPYKYADPNGKRLTDMFTIMITDKAAIPWGVAAQRAMYHGFGKPKKTNENN